MTKPLIFAALILFHSQHAHAEPAPKVMSDLERSVIKQIEGDSAKQFKLGKVKTVCHNAPPKPKDGDSFVCTATTRENKNVSFLAKVSAKEDNRLQVSLTATNLLDRGTLAELILKVLPEIADQAGEKVEAKSVNCGNYFVITDPANMLIPCTVSLSSNPQKRKAEIHFTKTLVTVKVEIPETEAKPPVK